MRYIYLLYILALYYIYIHVFIFQIMKAYSKLCNDNHNEFDWWRYASNVIHVWGTIMLGLLHNIIATTIVGQEMSQFTWCNILHGSVWWWTGILFVNGDFRHAHYSRWESKHFCIVRFFATGVILNCHPSSITYENNRHAIDFQYPICMYQSRVSVIYFSTWWHHQMETFSALQAICAGNSPVPGEFPAQRLVTQSFDVFFDLHPNKWLSKQWWGWWFETPSCHYDVTVVKHHLT